MIPTTGHAGEKTKKISRLKSGKGQETEEPRCFLPQDSPDSPRRTPKSREISLPLRGMVVAAAFQS